MKFWFSLFLFIFFLGSFSLLSNNIVVAVGATQNSALEQLHAGATGAGINPESKDPRIIITQIIEIFLGLVGAMMIFLFVYSGYLLITSHGDSAKLEKSRKIMTGAIIGIFIILLSFSITNFVGRKLQKSINQTNQTLPN